MPRRPIAPQAFLASLPLFQALDADTVARLAAATERRSLRRGELVFRQGDTPTGMFVLVYGEVRLLAHGPRGVRLTSVVQPGQSFGEPVMFLERPALVDAEAATDALVLHLPKEAVFAQIERDPRFARKVIAGLSQRVESLVQELGRLTLGSGRARLADYLLRLAGAAPQASFALPAAKAAVAAHLHLTPEHFSRLLHELAAEGLVQVEGRRITVADAQRLRGVAQPPGG